MSSSNVEFSDMQDRNLQTLTDIQGLQSIEKELFQNLETGLANNTLTDEQKNSIINKINEISQMRVNLYKNLNGMYDFFQKNITSSRDTIAEQTAAIDIVENELNESKKRLKVIQEENNNKLRLVEINSYYGDKYANHANIMKSIVYACIPIIILTILTNTGILPRNIYTILIVIVSVISVIYIGREIILAFAHDNMNYQEYTWSTKTSDLPEVDTENPEGSSDPWQGMTATCYGSACCYEGTTYDSATNKCIPDAVLAESQAAAAASEEALNSEEIAKKIAGSIGNMQQNMYQRQMGGFGGL